MKKALVAFASGTVLFLGATPLAGAMESPPRGSCNAGTMHAHETVPHETEGNHVAHMNIPHCEHEG